MFKFLTIIFTLFYIYRAISPINFTKHAKYLQKQQEKREQGDVVELDSEGFRMAVLLFSMFGFQLLEFLYLCFALNHDIYKYPTIIMLLWFVIAYSRSMRNKKEINLEKYSKFSYKIKCRFSHVLDVCYFGYIFYLIFLI